MFVVDDPFLALILRFVVDTADSASTNKEFLDGQLKAMRQHLAQFPKAEHGSRAMEWIGQRAAKYRRDWERNTLANRTVYLRCADCPLIDAGAAEQCEIHEQWLYLLHRYLGYEVTTRDYIEDSLSLLREYKDQLKHRQAIIPSDANKSKKEKRKQKKKKKKKKKKNKSKKASKDNAY